MGGCRVQRQRRGAPPGEPGRRAADCGHAHGGSGQEYGTAVVSEHESTLMRATGHAHKGKEGQGGVPAFEAALAPGGRWRDPLGGMMGRLDGPKRANYGSSLASAHAARSSFHSSFAPSSFACGMCSSCHACERRGGESYRAPQLSATRGRGTRRCGRGGAHEQAPEDWHGR